MKTYQKSIIFTKVPLPGQYRYKDQFQIYPATDDVLPKSAFQKHYPVILEYWFAEEDKITTTTEFKKLQDLQTLTATTITKKDRILSLLTSFTNNRFFYYQAYEGNWGMPMLYDDISADVSAEINTWASKWCLSNYHFPSLPDFLQIQKFSDLRIPHIQTLPHNAFYTYLPSLDSSKDDWFVFPSTLDQLFDSYYSLEEGVKEIVNAAIDYNVSAVELVQSKRTMSLLASFTALETMVNLEFKEQENEKCETCGQVRFSVAKKFRSFLLKYIGDSTENRKKFNGFYSLRSKIVHTGRLLKTERLFNQFPEEEQNEEYIKRLEILQLGKLAVVNWLLKHESTFMQEQ